MPAERLELSIFGLKGRSPIQLGYAGDWWVRQESNLPISRRSSALQAPWPTLARLTPELSERLYGLSSISSLLRSIRSPRTRKAAEVSLGGFARD